MRALMPEHRAIAAEAIRRVRLAHLDDESGYRATARALSPLLLSAGDMAFVYDWRDGLGKVGHTRADGASWNSIVRHDLLAPLIRYDPTRPGPDANRIVPSWRWSSAAPAVRLMRSAFWPLNDFGEQVRSALYDGERYLGLVGIFSDGRHDKPSLETIRMFAAVMPAAAEVLWGEALVRRSEETRLPFDRLLDAMEAPTLLVAPSGTVLHATPSARDTIGTPLRDALALGPGCSEGLRALRSVARVVAMPVLGRTTWIVQPRTSMPASAPLPASLQRVAKRVAEGMSDDQIAHEIGLTTKTIRTYVERIYRSLGVHSRAALVLALRKAHTR
jgi:hypothetical protein